MKKIIFTFPFLLVPFFAFSCNQIPNGTISTNKTDITLVKGEEAIIRCTTTNNQKCTGYSSNTAVVAVPDPDDEYTKYNNYVWLFGTEIGTSTITVTANKCPSITLNVKVIEDKNPKYITDQSSYTIAEATPLIDEAIVDNYKTIYISQIIGLNNEPKKIINYLELENTSYNMTAYGTGTVGSTPVYVYVFSYFESGYTYHDPANSGTNVKNANLELRSKSITKRAKGSLPIDSVTETKKISNTDQLWWALEHGYKPDFVDQNSTAKQCYDAAYEICRNYIGSGFGETDKVRTMFDYMTSNMKYNNWVVQINANDDWTKYTDYFLEGPLLHNVGVCDGFSKMLAMLGGIEQINNTNSQRLIRCGGYTTQGAGHAWDYYSPDGNTYYLICPTWGQTTINAFGYEGIITKYSAFMTKRTYFNDMSKGSYNFSDLYWQGVDSKKSSSVYSDQTGLGINPDATTLANKCAQISGDYVLNVVCTSEDYMSTLLSKFPAKKTSIYYTYIYNKYYAYVLVNN